MSKRHWHFALNWFYTFLLCLLYPFGYAFNALVKHMQRMDRGLGLDKFFYPFHPVHVGISTPDLQ